ncbi:unnamed protein product [Caenorhabditis angaria]|uniref:F-box domain-containing protein n=1 Tax=Caenorhabditis angaria TaxID=860376 RepID=A0A9P1IJ04_9PELO|nr:unnamed protein product [Caenorhabditis angaria]
MKVAANKDPSGELVRIVFRSIDEEQFAKMLAELGIKSTSDHAFQNYQEIEEEKEEPPIKKLPFEVLGAIFEKLEYEDVQNLKNSSKFLFDAHKLERRKIAGPKCDANVYYNKNKELRLEITIFVEVPWIRILPFKRTIELKRTIPFDQWNYYFKNAECEIFSMIVEEDEIPFEILKKILCCKSIDILTYSGKTINQMSIDLLAAYNYQHFEIAVNRWSFIISQKNVNETWVLIEWFENIDDIFEAIKFTYDSIISLHPEIYEKNEDSFMVSFTAKKGNTIQLRTF